MIIDLISDITSTPLFFRLAGFLEESEVFVKLEGLNIAGSIKLTTAKGLIDSLEKQGSINQETVFIESSSGNLGVALSILCKQKGYPFICVTDPNILPENEKLILLYGAQVIKITDRDANGGYLASRIKFIYELLERNPNYIWLNQYANQANPSIHYQSTARQILDQFCEVDYLFVGAGTTGTLMGCASFFKENSPKTKIIAVDSIGSVTFGFPPKKRYIPGVGTSRRPEIVDESKVDEILMIDEKEAVKMCHFLINRYGLLLGGSSGTVLQGIREYADKIPRNSRVVTISPDFGQKYINNVYDDAWVKERFN